MKSVVQKNLVKPSFGLIWRRAALCLLGVFCVFGVVHFLSLSVRIGVDRNEPRCLKETVYLRLLNDSSPVFAGEYISFMNPMPVKGAPPDQLFAKRVVGVDGDEVEVRGERLYINGREAGGMPLCDLMLGGMGVCGDKKYKLKKDEYFVMGDHLRSYDSRYWGVIKREQVLGHVIPLF